MLSICIMNKNNISTIKIVIIFMCKTIGIMLYFVETYRISINIILCCTNTKNDKQNILLRVFKYCVLIVLYCRLEILLQYY